MIEQPANGKPSSETDDDDQTPADTAPVEYRQFDDLMRKLIKVPKSELDERRKTA